MTKNELKEKGYMSLLAICLRLRKDKRRCSNIPQEILNLATVIGRERYFPPENISIVEKYLLLSEKDKNLPPGYKTLTSIMKEFKSSYIPPKELLLDEIIFKGHKYYGEKTIEAIRNWLFEYENLTNVTLRVLGYKFDQSLIPEELKVGGLHKGNGIAYPPETIENISKWLMEYVAIPMIEKMKATNLKRYGVENPFQAEQFKEKSRQTCLAKYGVDCYAKTEESRKATGVRLNSPEIMEKRFATNLEKYGSTCPMQSEENKEKIKKTFLEKYGQEAYMGSEDFKQKVKETVKEKYGVDNVSQLEEVKDLKRKGRGARYNYDNHFFDSSWELAFYYFLKKKGVDFEFQPVDARIDYMYNGEKHTYYPDFKVGNQIVEIKGDQFFDENGKMINPFDRSQDELFEAKHQCMLQNNVRILTEKELDKIIDLAYNELGDLKQFRIGEIFD